MKRLFSLCLCLFVLAASCTVVAAAETEGSCGDGVSWSYDAQSATLSISGTGAISDFKDVASVPWKSYCKEIRNISISEGITAIGNYAFSWCENVTSVTVPATVTKIGADAFGWCAALESVSLPEGLQSIGSEAFVACTSLKTVGIPAGVTSIGNSPFMSCFALTDINVNSGNSKYKSFDGVLYDLSESSLICYPMGKTADDVQVPSNITKIGDSAFTDNETIRSVSMPSVKEVGAMAFFACRNLYSVDASSVETIGDMAFYKCDNMVSINLPAAAAVGKQAFRNCINLQLAMFGNNSVQIGEDVFKGDPYIAIVANNGSAAQNYAYANSITYNGFVSVYYGGAEVEYDPAAFIVNDATTLVPMRQVFEMLGAQVTWDDGINTAIAKKDGIAVSIAIGSPYLYKNGEEIPLPETGKLIADRTYVPLRAVTEAFGNTVEWVDATNTVNIY